MGLKKQRRLELDSVLKSICPNVYYQPPSSTNMKYPAIRYRRSNIDTVHADNSPYIQTVRYELIVIDRNPDSEIVEALSQLPKCSHARHYTVENLNHDVFYISY